MRDYTPATPVTAGDMIDIGGLVYVAHSDIAADELNALACPYGGTAYRITLATGDTFTDGAIVTVNPATGETNAALGTFFGYAEGAADQTAGDTVVVARHSMKQGA